MRAYAAWFSAIFLGIGVQAVASEPEASAESDSLEAIMLGEMIVTSDRWREGSHARTTIITAAELATTPGNTAQDILKSVPGVTVSAGRKDEASITVRGFGAKRVAIMIDGRPVNLPYYGTVNLGAVHTGQLDGIMVVRGPAGVTYGPNVMGGVVNFTTTRGRTRRGTHVRLQAGNHDTGELQVTHGRVHGNWDLLLSVQGGGSDGTVMSHEFTPVGVRATENGDLRDNSDFAEWDAFAKLGYRHGVRTDLALSGGYHTLEKGVPAAVDEERYWRFEDWRRYFADLTLRHEWDAHTFFEGKVYGDVFVNTLVDYENDSYDRSAVFYDSTHDTWDAGGIVALEREWTPTHHGSYGVTVREDQIKKRMNPDEPWLFHHQVTGALHAEHNVKIRSRCAAMCGLAHNFMIHNHLGDVEHILGYSAGAMYRLAGTWRITAATGQSSRFPTLSQLWGSTSGNRDLAPELARRLEVGVDGSLTRFADLALTAFGNDLRDLIDRDVRRAGKYYNISSARTYGLELELDLTPIDWLTLRSAYTYTEAENRDSDLPLDLTPEHKFDARLIASSASGETQWVLILTHIGERFDSEALTADQMLPAYTTVDCRVSTRIHRHIALGLEVTNLGDRNYEEEVMYPAPGRTVLVDASLDF